MLIDKIVPKLVFFLNLDSGMGIVKSITLPFRIDFVFFSIPTCSVLQMIRDKLFIYFRPLATFNLFKRHNEGTMTIQPQYLWREISKKLVHPFFSLASTYLLVASKIMYSMLFCSNTFAAAPNLMLRSTMITFPL
jgi:hypothetical protein